MNTQQRSTSYTGPFLVLLAIWLLFLGGLDAVQTWTARLAQQPTIVIAPGSLGGPASNAVATPAAPGQLAPLTLDGQPAPDAPAQAIQPQQAAPVAPAEAVQPAQPAPQVQPKQQAASALPTAAIIAPQRQQRVAVQQLPPDLLPTPIPPTAAPIYPTNKMAYTTVAQRDSFGKNVQCVVTNTERQVCNTTGQPISADEAKWIAGMVEAGMMGSEPAK